MIFLNLSFAKISHVSLQKEKTKFKKHILENKDKKILAIADGAAFGPEMEEIYQYINEYSGVYLFLPESFEWIILSSVLIDGNRIREILQRTGDYVDSSLFFSWEQFFTRILIDETKDTYLHYQKEQLNITYLHKKEKTSLCHTIETVLNETGIVEGM